MRIVHGWPPTRWSCVWMSLCFQRDSRVRRKSRASHRAGWAGQEGLGGACTHASATCSCREFTQRSVNFFRLRRKVVFMRSTLVFCLCNPLCLPRRRACPWRNMSLLVLGSAGKAAQFWGPFYGPKIGQESVNPNSWGSHFAALFLGRNLAPKLGSRCVTKLTLAAVPLQPCRS